MRISIILLSLFLASGCASKYTPVRSETKVYDLGKMGLVLKDSVAESMISPYRDKLNSEMDEVIGISDVVMEKGLPEGLLGNFSSDACYNIGLNFTRKKNLPAVDMCFLNNGGLRNSLPKGNITIRMIFELMPFENELVILELSPEKMTVLLDFIARKGGMPVSGISFQIVDEKASNIKIGGEEFKGDRNYYIITSDYLANGGDDLGFLSKPISSIFIDTKVRDAIIEYVRIQKAGGKNLNPKIEGRISYARP